jgi:hypothetical protein
MISEAMIRSAQTVHQYYIMINTISKLTETSFHLTDVNYEYRRVSPKWFPCLWYIRHKRCTYLALRLMLSPYGLKQVSTWPMSPRTPIRRTQKSHQVCPKWFLSLWYIQRKPCTYLVSRLTQSPNRRKRASTWSTSPRSSIGCIQNNFQGDCTFGAKLCTYLLSRLTLSPNGPKRASTWPMSCWSTTGSIQNDIWAYGTFSANHAPILYRD